MRYKVDGLGDVDRMMAGTEADVARAMTATVREGAEGIRDTWRDQITAARLGPRLARTVRSRVYPQGQDSVEAAAMIWTNAPDIIDSYARGATIRPVNGAKYLWIPTGEVPRKRQGNALTPEEVEARFGRELVVVDPKHWRMKTSTTLTKHGVAFAGFSGLVPRKTTGRWRNATPNQMTKGHRSYRETTRQFVVMFTLVPSVKKDKRLDLEAIARAAEAAFPSALSRNWR